MSCIGRSLTPSVPGPQCGSVCLGAGAVVIGGGWAISSPISHPRAFTFRPRRPTGPRYPSHRRARGGTGWPGGRLAYPHLRALREAPRPRPAAEPREGAQQPARLRQNTRLSRNLETQGSRCHLRVTSSKTPVIKCFFPAPSPGCGSPPCQGGKDKTWG